MRRALICALVWVGSMTAQNSPYRVQTKVVQVPVLVTGKDGALVDSLAARDFTVLDNGVRQEATLDDFSTGVAPISLVIAVQTSGISRPVLVKIRQIGGLIQPLVTGQQGEAAVLAFDNRLHWLQDFTSDDDKIRAAVQSLGTGKSLQGGRMLDAVAVAAGHLQRRSGRKILLLISESRDRGSETKMQEALETLGRQGIEVFGAHYSAFATNLISKSKDLPDLTAEPELPDDPLDPPAPAPSVDFGAILFELSRLGKTNTVQALARATGGVDYPFLKERGIETAIEKLGVDVHSQYLLSFPQHEGAAGMHAIDVSVPGRADARLRWRRTYWADESGSAASTAK